MNNTKLKIKSLKVDLTKVPFKEPSKVNDGTNGKILEQSMKKQGFPVDSTGTVDLPTINIEIKTRSANTNSHHTIGNMKFDDIISSSKVSLGQSIWGKTKESVSPATLAQLFAHEIGLLSCASMPRWSKSHRNSEII